MYATMADAHLEWHRNVGIPVGTPGCPQDACHLPDPGCWECFDEDPACPACTMIDLPPVPEGFVPSPWPEDDSALPF